MFREENIIVDLKVKEYNSLRLKQLDTTKLNIKVINDGLEVNLTELDVNIIFTKPNNLIVIQSSNISKNDSTFSVILIDDCLRVAGEAKIEVELKKDTEIVSSFFIPIKIESTSKGKIESDNTKNYIEKIEEAMQQFNSDFKNLIEEIRSDYQEIVGEDLRVEIIEARGEETSLKNRLNKMQTDIINDMSKKYTGTTITTPTVAGFGRLDKIYGDTVEVGTGEKSPDNPYELKCVGNDVNLLKLIPQTVTMNNVTFTMNLDGTVVANGTASDIAWVAFDKFQINANVDYTLSGCPKGGGDNTYKVYGMRMSDYGGAGNDIGSGSSFNLSQNVEVEYRVRIAKGYTANNLVFKPKLQKGSVATAYSNYGEGTVEIISKNGSNTTSNVIYKGKPLCALKNVDDEYIASDRIEGTKVYRECELKILDGTEKWIKSVGTSTDDITACWITLNNAGIYNCDKFEIIQSGDTSTKQEVMVVSNTAISIKVLNSRLSSADAVGFKEWLAKNPVTIVYRLEAPIIEDINGSNKIVQYAESTTVYSRDTAELEVTLTNNKAVSDVYGDLKNIEEKLKQDISKGQEIPTNDCINNKRIYKKIIDFGTLPNATLKNVNHNIPNINNIINIFGIATNISDINKNTIPIPYVDPENILNSISLSSTKDQVRIKTGTNRSGWNANVTILYTKED